MPSWSAVRQSEKAILIDLDSGLPLNLFLADMVAGSIHTGKRKVLPFPFVDGQNFLTIPLKTIVLVATFHRAALPL